MYWNSEVIQHLVDVMEKVKTLLKCLEFMYSIELITKVNICFI